MAPTMIDPETASEPPSPVIGSGPLSQSGVPRTRSRSRGASRETTLPHGATYVRSFGRTFLLPVVDSQTSSGAEPSVRADAWEDAPLGATVRIRSAGSVASMHSAGDGLQQFEMPVGADTVEADTAFEDPLGGEWRMNGSCMPEPDEPDNPPPATGPRAIMMPVLTAAPPPLVRPSCLGLHFMAMGSGMGSTMCVGGAFRDMLTSQHTVEAFLTDSSDRGLEAAYHYAAGRVGKYAQRGVVFYIGITENPARREEEQLERGWDGMEVLVEAPSSRESGMLEARLIERFSRAFLCQNLGRGNERPSGGRPHYVYVVVRNSGLLRRGR